MKMAKPHFPQLKFLIMDVIPSVLIAIGGTGVVQHLVVYNIRDEVFGNGRIVKKAIDFYQFQWLIIHPKSYLRTVALVFFPKPRDVQVEFVVKILPI